MLHHKTVTKKLMSIALVSVFAITPLAFGVSVAQADPPRHAPAWGWRDKNRDHDRDRDRDRNRRDRDRRDRDRRDRDRRDRDRRDRDRRDYRTFTGTVERVNSSSHFRLRSGGQTYDVYASGRMSRRLDRNDVVRVYGYRYGSNDIRNANVTVLRNR